MAQHAPERRARRGGKPRAAGETSRNGCQVCGLNVAERELVAEAIRVGLTFDNAVGFVRHSRAVFAQKGAA